MIESVHVVIEGSIFDFDLCTISWKQINVKLGLCVDLLSVILIVWFLIKNPTFVCKQCMVSSIVAIGRLLMTWVKVVILIFHIFFRFCKRKYFLLPYYFGGVYERVYQYTV